jgi:hypothetical protein
MNKLSPADMAWLIGNSLLAASRLAESRINGDETRDRLDRSRLFCLLEHLSILAEGLGNELSDLGMGTPLTSDVEESHD